VEEAQEDVQGADEGGGKRGNNRTWATSNNLYSAQAGQGGH